MNATLMRVTAVPLLLLASACSSPVPAAVPGMAYAPPGASKAGTDAIANLINQTGAASADEAEVRDLLRRSTGVTFPARLGVLFYNYEPPLQDEERQQLLTRFGQDVVASGLARSAVAVPDELGRGVTLEAMRKLAARLQLDALVLVGGESEFTRSEVQPGGLLAAFSNAANFEARTALTGFTLDIYAGTLLAPIAGVGVTSPTLLDPTADSFPAASRKLQADGFTAAATQLKDALIASLRQARDQQAAAPTPLPTAAGSPSPEPSPSASPSPAPTP